MKLTLETDKGQKISVQNNAASDLELMIDDLTVERMFEQLRVQLEQRRELSREADGSDRN